MKKMMFGLMFAGAVATAAFAELPTAAQIQKNMGMGFNIGNTMEVPNNPTGWGNAFPTQALLDSIKAAGFNTVRIPCAWDSHAPGGRITETWLDSVKTVVDYAMRAGLYTILNIHHEGEGGWFQTHIGTSVDNGINTKMKNYWTQIANKFKNYDEHLLFAGANEPGPNIKQWSSAHVNTLMSYYQTFVDAVRGTGANNTSRTLIIQGLNTDIDKSVESVPVSVFPKDKITGRLMFEVHYYDPYNYTLMTKEDDWGCNGGEMVLPRYYYGNYQKDSDLRRNAGYNCWGGGMDANLGGIGHANEQFAKMKSNYVDKGYPVIVGEFGANTRSPELSGSDLNLSKQGRIQWHKDVCTAAKNYGLTPILWDMGNESNSQYDNMAYIRHSTAGAATMGKVVDLDVINAMRSVYGLGNYVNKGITHQDNLVPGSTPIGNSSSSTASSSSVQPVQSSSSVASSSSMQQPAQSSSSSSVNPWQPQSSSSNNQPPCDALIPECGYTPPTCDALIPECGYSPESLCAMGITEYCMPTTPDPWAIASASTAAKASLSRQGNLLVAQGNRASIQLFDLNGNLVREVRALSSQAILSLAGLRQGTYIAQSGNRSLKVIVK